MSKHLSYCLRVALISCLLILGACSSPTFVYNRLDFIVPWYVDDYADLNRDQDKYLDDLLEPFLRWHRTQELPRYVELLDRIESHLGPPVAPEDIAAIVADFQQAWSRLEVESIEWLLALGAQLSDEQIDGFLELMEEQQTEYQEEYLTRSDEEAYEESYDDMHDTAKDYIGKLSPLQTQRLHVASRKLIRSDHAWLAERGDWNAKLAVLLQREAGWQQRVREAVSARLENAPEEFARVYEHNMAVINVVTADTLNGLSEKQHRHLQKKLAALREDLTTLIAQGDPTAQSKAS